MSTSTAMIQNNKQLYANSFWSIDSVPQETLILQNEKATKTLHSLSSFYKEFINLENEYSRKFNTLLNRIELPKHEYTGTLKTSIDVFQDQCTKISETHSLQARRVNDSLYQPLLELISDRKAREKALEVKIRQMWGELVELKNKCDSKSEKYEDVWSTMSSLKRSRMTLDNREAQKLEQKLSSLKTKMLILRQENWELVNKYNEKLESWLSLWWDSCNDWQTAEEDRIRFLKSNLWEFANIISLFCVEDDQLAENIRVSLQSCSAKADISNFVSEYSTGDEILAPIKFVDFAKNETRPIVEEKTKRFNIMDIPTIRDKVNEERERRQKKRIPPPKQSEQAEAAFAFIGKSKETFKQLQDEAQREVSERRLNAPQLNNDSSKSLSEPSTYKAMSDYSNPTDPTSISSNNSFNEDSFEDHVIVGYKKNQNNNQNRISMGSHGYGFEDDSHDEDLSDNPIKNALINLKNSDKLRESMSPVKDSQSKKDKHNSFANIVKKTFNESPDGSSKNKQFGFKQVQPDSTTSSPKNKKDYSTEKERLINNNSLMLKNQDISKLRASHKHVNSISMKKSKSQWNIKDRHVSLSELPSHSSEGYPVISYTKAQYSYSAAIEEELSFKKKDILLILHKQSDGWWFAENLNSGDSGLAPSNYLVEIK